jgi:PAS domain S-box-containing protein
MVLIVHNELRALRDCDSVVTEKPLTGDERAAQLLRAIVDSSDDAIISKDLNSIITSWNKGAERLFGYTEDEAVGQPITILIPHDRLDEEPQILARIKSGERVDHFETIRRRKDGRLLEISVTISPVKDHTGTVVGASKIARDITERKRAEEEIRRANHDLEQFAFSASHDLQEPLRTVNIYSELLTQRYGNQLDGQALEFLGHIRKGATRMEMLVRDLLSFAQLTKFEVNLEATDANEALSKALADLEGAIQESKVRVTTDPLPSVRIHGRHLQQVFQNLVGNAIKYRSAERAPLVHISAESKDGGAVFSVSDNGIGLDPKYNQTIFGLFKRLHTSSEYEGTGLGLAICQRIVDQYNGRIWVDSEVGKGSVFKFILPG